MGENFWTVEKLTEVQRALESMTETAEGESHLIIKADRGIGHLVWDWLHDNSQLRIDLSQTHSAIAHLVKLGVISRPLERKGPKRFHRFFYPGVEIDEDSLTVIYG